jgi:uncharacterized protein
VRPDWTSPHATPLPPGPAILEPAPDPADSIQGPGPQAAAVSTSRTLDPDPPGDPAEPAALEAPGQVQASDGLSLPLCGRAEERWIRAERLAGAVLWGVIALVSAGGLVWTLISGAVAPGPSLVLFGLLLALLGWWLWRRPVRLQAVLSYRLDAEALTIQQGLLWRHWICVPRARVQYVDLVAGPIDQRFNLKKLVIHTAGSSYSEVELPGLSVERALVLRGELVRGLERSVP